MGLRIEHWVIPHLPGETVRFQGVFILRRVGWRVGESARLH